MINEELDSKEWPAFDAREVFLLEYNKQLGHQQYGINYVTSSEAAGDVTKLWKAAKLAVSEGKSVYVVIYLIGRNKQTPYSFSAWGLVKATEEIKSKDSDEKSSWVITLDWHEFPVPVSLKGSAGEKLLEDLDFSRGKDLTQIFNRKSIQTINPKDFYTIIGWARSKANRK